MLTLLGFGSSARRGATGWTDRERVRRLLAAARPELVVDGASPAGGADDLVHEEALALGFQTERCPVDHELDGRWPGAGIARNIRQYRIYRPQLAAGFITGNVGSPMSSGSAQMYRTCLRGVADVRPCAVVIYRDNGIEPYETLTIAYQQLRRLWAATKDDRIVAPGHALLALRAGQCGREEAIAALGYAAEGSRWAPWLEAVITTVRSR